MASAAAVSTSALGLATAVPPHRLDQDDVAQFARRVYARSFARYPKLADVYANAGINHRYSVRPLEWFERPHDWRERTQAYLDGADALFVEAAGAALKRAGVSARDVDVIVTVSSTGIATPSLEARVGQQLGFRPDAVRVPVFGLGCAGGVSGLGDRARGWRAPNQAKSCCCRGRALHAGVSQRPQQQGRRDFLGAVRRWRGGGGAARRQ